VRRSALPGVAVTTLALGTAAALVVALTGTYYGDSSIYLPFARNAADGDPFSFNPGEFSSGSTSPLWSLLLAPAFLVGADAEGAKAIAGVLTVAATGLVAAAAWRVSDSLLDAALAVFLLFPVLGFLGAVLYEVPLTVGLVALSIVLGERFAKRIRGGAPLELRALAPLGIVWAALPLARPEAAALVVLEALALWWLALPDRRGLRVLAIVLAAAALPALAYFGYSAAELGTASTSSEARAAGLRDVADRLGPLPFASGPLQHLVSLPFALGFVPALGGLWLLARRPDRRWVAAYAAGAVAAYVAVFTFVSPADFEADRYLMPALPFVVIALACALAASRGTRARLPVLALAAALVVAPALERSEDQARRQRSLGLSLEQATEASAARAIERVARPGDVVLTYEVQVRYQLPEAVRVLSLDGVTDGRVVDYRDRPDGLAAFLHRYRPRFWIASAAPVLAGRPALRRSVLASVATRFERRPDLPSVVAGGVRFRELAARGGGTTRLFGGWARIFELSYPPRERAASR
jgi:hypothetical protein